MKSLPPLSLLLALFTFIGLASGLAGPAVSPLTPGNDKIGAALQKTMIWTSPGVKTSSSFVAFRKTFTLAAPPREATLHLFADVRYMLWVNGQYVTRGPVRFEPTGPEYDSIPVAKWLRPGKNQLVVLVMGNASNGKMRRHAPGLTARLDLDGGRTALVTDGSWKWSDQTRYRTPEINWGNTMDRIDARVEDGDWTQLNYNDFRWKPAASVDGAQWGPLTARRIPLLRETPVPVKFDEDKKLPVTLAAGQKLGFDAGRLVQAYTLLEIDADAGTKLDLGYANIEVIARGGRQTYLSSDTHGFANGEIAVKSGRAKILGFQLIERLYPFDVVGSFKSSDEMLNRLWAMCARSCQIFSEDSFVDCADRERTEWMDDDPPGFDIVRTAMAGPGPNGSKAYADARLLGAMLRRTALTVQPEGWVKAHTASDRFDIHAKMEDRACDWVEGARRYYESTGDDALIREIWPVIVRQMKYFLDRRTPRGLVLAREWVVWGNPVGYVTCEGAGLNAFVYKALVDAAFLGQAIGEKSQAASFAQDAKNLMTAFNTVLWDEKAGTYYSGYYAAADRAKADKKAQDMKLKVENNLIEPTMFAALWALDQQIVPEARRASVTRYLLDHRSQAERIMTFYYLFKQLYAADTDAFDREILASLRTNWKAMSEWPWMTAWEEFNGGSKAHIYGMFPGYFLSAYVLGVRPEGATSSRRLTIEPHLGDLAFAEGVVVTEFGPVPVSWKIDMGKLAFQLNVPPGVTAVLRLPGSGPLVLDGKPHPVTPEGRRFVVEVGPGPHRGFSGIR